LQGAQLGAEHAQHFVVPGAGEAAAGAVVGDLQVFQALCAQLLDLGFQALAPFHEVRHALGVAEVHLVHDGQHRDLKQDGVQPRPDDADVQLAIGQGGDGDVLLVQAEQPRKSTKSLLIKRMDRR